MRRPQEQVLFDVRGTNMEMRVRRMTTAGVVVNVNQKKEATLELCGDQHATARIVSPALVAK